MHEHMEFPFQKYVYSMSLRIVVYKCILAAISTPLVLRPLRDSHLRRRSIQALSTHASASRSLTKMAP